MITEITDKKGKNRDYEVGYKKPPVATQFKPGEVHNPTGRPPNKKYLSEIARELLEEVPKGETDGRNADILVVLALIRKALSGDTRAIEMLHDWTEGKVADKHQLEVEAKAVMIQFVPADRLEQITTKEE